jgi:hypothetical protein
MSCQDLRTEQTRGKVRDPLKSPAATSKTTAFSAIRLRK